MLVTLSGTTTSVNAIQFKNADASIVIKVFGSSTLFNDSTLSNALDEIVLIPSDKTAVSKALSLNAYEEIVLTLPGITILFKPLFANAYSPISVTLFGISTLTRPLAL